MSMVYLWYGQGVVAVNCRGCGSMIAPDAAMLVHESRTQFELLDGWRLPFHMPCCSEVCRAAVELRERETLAVYVPPVDERTMMEKYPDAFRRKPKPEIH